MRGVLYGLVMGLGLAIAGSILTTIVFEIFARVIDGEDAALMLGDVEEAIWEFAFLSGLVPGLIVGWRRASREPRKRANCRQHTEMWPGIDTATPINSDPWDSARAASFWMRTRGRRAARNSVSGMWTAATGCVSLVLALTVIYWFLGAASSGRRRCSAFSPFLPCLLAILIGPIVGWWKAAKRAKGTAQ